MKFSLTRSYFPDGTNGRLMCGEHIVCHTIELPWLQNQRNVSCVPEGSYSLKKRYTESRGWHILVEEVPGRSLILFHVGNDALTDLRGCIAPVSELTGHGTGIQSSIALKKFQALVFSAMELEEEAMLTITGK